MIQIKIHGACSAQCTVEANVLTVNRWKGKALKPADHWKVGSAYATLQREAAVKESHCPTKGCPGSDADLVSVTMGTCETSILCRVCGTRRIVGYFPHPQVQVAI